MFTFCYNLRTLDLQEVDVIAILGPFLDVIRSEDTTGPITGFALSAVNKFLCYGLIGKMKNFVNLTTVMQNVYELWYYLMFTDIHA